MFHFCLPNLEVISRPLKIDHATLGDAPHVGNHSKTYKVDTPTLVLPRGLPKVVGGTTATPKQLFASATPLPSGATYA